MDSAKWWYYTQQNGGYYPQSLASLGYNVWDWDASRLTGVVNGTPQPLLYQNNGATNPITANGQTVGTWVDGVQGVEADNATGTQRPTYTTNSLNGKPTLTFNVDVLGTTDMIVGTFALWVVYKRSSGTYIVYEQSENDSTNRMLHYGTIIEVARSSVATTKTKTTAMPQDTFFTMRHEYNGTNASHLMYINNALQTMTNSATGDPGTGTITKKLYIGARNNLALGLVGNIAHVCIVSPYPTTDIITQMESYINSKWQVY